MFESYSNIIMNLLFIVPHFRCPDGASIKKKMVYASSASAIKASLGTGKILQFQVCGEGIR